MYIHGSAIYYVLTLFYCLMYRYRWGYPFTVLYHLNEWNESEEYLVYYQLITNSKACLLGHMSKDKG